MASVSDRNGVPDSANRRGATSNARRTASPHARSSPAWWISSSTTIAPAAIGRRASGFDATCW
jgi:hypothetical protein